MQRLTLVRSTVALAVGLLFAGSVSGLCAQAAGGSVTGKLVNAEGEPLAGTEVQILELSLTATTDDAGAFRFDGIPIGQQALTIRAGTFESSTLTVGILFPGYLRDLGQITVEARAGGATVAAGDEAVEGEELEKSDDPNILLRGDIAESDAQTMEELLQRLRPRWLRVRGMVRDVAGNRTEIKVYVDGSNRGSIEVLASITTQQVREVRWVAPRDATTRYGIGHGAGVIEVITR